MRAFLCQECFDPRPDTKPCRNVPVTKPRSDGDINTLHRTIVYIYFVLSRLQVIASLYIKSFGESTLDIQQGYPQKFLSVSREQYNLALP